MRGLRYVYSPPDEDSENTLYFELAVGQALCEMLIGITL